MRFITPLLHGMLDYVVAIVLVTFPAVLGSEFSGAVADPAWLTAATLSISIGVILFLYSLLTAYPDGLVRVIPFKVHLAIDAIAALALIALPFVLPNAYGEIGKWAHIGTGIVVLIVVALTNPSAPMRSPSQSPSAS